MKRTVLVLDELQADELEALSSGLGGEFEVHTAAANGLVRIQASVLISRQRAIDAAMLVAMPGVRTVVMLDGAGTVDREAAASRAITVHDVPSLSLITVAEHTILLMLALVKRFVTATEDLRSGVVVDGVQPARTTQTSYAFNWIGLSGFDALYGKRVGLVGVGKIGREVATRLRAFGCDVIYTKRSPFPAETEQSLGIRFLPADELLAESDIVSLHHRWESESDPFMGAAEFARMKAGSYFVNTARGRLVDEAALIAALESGRLAGAALDVFQYEPLPPDSPLLRAPNLILTPHVGGIPSHISSVIELGDVARLIRSST